VRIAALPPRDALPAVRQLIPSLRSILVGLVILAAAVGAYVVAWDTPLFAVRTLDVRGGTPQLRAEARAALREEEGRSLLRVDRGAIDAQLRAIPEIRGFTYDRAFPHTLRVVLRREVPVLVVRRVPGPDAVLVAASGKVLRVLAHPRLSHLPRLWVEKQVPISVAERLPQPIAGAAAALSSLREASLPGGVQTVSVGPDELTLTLGRGLQVRLGDDGDLRLKLAIARRILRETGAAAAGVGYVDVSVPERPVLSTNPQVGG